MSWQLAFTNSDLSSGLYFDSNETIPLQSNGLTFFFNVMQYGRGQDDTREARDKWELVTVNYIILLM